MSDWGAAFKKLKKRQIKFHGKGDAPIVDHLMRPCHNSAVMHSTPSRVRLDFCETPPSHLSFNAEPTVFGNNHKLAF